MIPLSFLSSRLRMVQLSLSRRRRFPARLPQLNACDVRADYMGVCAGRCEWVNAVGVVMTDAQIS
jgi:hypothetical protein